MFRPWIPPNQSLDRSERRGGVTREKERKPRSRGKCWQPMAGPRSLSLFHFPFSVFWVGRFPSSFLSRRRRDRVGTRGATNEDYKCSKTLVLRIDRKCLTAGEFRKEMGAAPDSVLPGTGIEQSSRGRSRGSTHRPPQYVSRKGLVR